MSISMIQNSIAHRKAEQSKSPAKLRNGEIDYRHLQVGAKPLAPKGKLVRGSIFGVSDTVDQIKYLGAGLKGDANDHKLGKINDLAMKVGALSIAGYLATKRPVPVKKGMEFVGAGTFFAAMALWPKVFIQAPIQAMYGFNVNQKWQDSIGRKNDFFRDPQYTPWDIMSSEKIEKVGDRMGVDKNMKDRQSLIKDKMKKTSIQANTLWMLTAGFATPLMGALMASGLEKPLENMIEKAKTKKVNKRLDNIKEIIENKTKTENVDLTKHLNAMEGKEISEDFIAKTAKIMTAGNDELMTENVIKEDLENLLLGDKKADKVSDLFEKAQKSDTFKTLGITKEDIAKHLETENLEKGINLSSDKDKVSSSLNSLYKSKAKALRESGTDKFTIKKLRKPFDAIIEQTLDAKPVLSKEKIEKVGKISKVVEGYKTRMGVLDDYIKHYFVNQDSVKAHSWKKVTEGTMKVLGFKDKELKAMSTSPDKARELMEAKFTEIAKNDEKYKKVFGKVAELISDFDSNVVVKVEDKVDSHIIEAAKEMKDSGLTKTAQYLVGSDDFSQDLKGCLKRNKMLSVKDDISGAKASLYKVLHGLDFFRTLESKKGFKHVLTNEWGKSEEHANKVVKVMKTALMEGRIGENVVKFDIPNRQVYNNFVHLLYHRKSGDGARDIELNSLTNEVLNGSEETKKLKENLYKHWDEISNDVGNSEYKFKPGHNLGGGTGKQIREIHMMLGESLAETAKKTAGSLYNTKKWLKMFGGASIGLAAVTLVAPMFFGKIKTDNNQGGQG